MAKVTSAVKVAPLGMPGNSATGLMAEKNLSGAVLMSDMNTLAKDPRKVYVHNVSEKQYKVCRPWAHPQYIVPARKPGERYATGNPIDYITQEATDAVTGTLFIHSRGVSGLFLAADLLNPDNVNDWRQQTPSTTPRGDSGNEGTNLIDCGCFYSLDEVPTEEDLLLAEKNLEARYYRLLDEANLWAMEGPLGMARITSEHRQAANHFGIETTWNTKPKSKVECEGCGELINKTVAVCPICKSVRDWDKAIRLGQKTEADRPKAAA